MPVLSSCATSSYRGLLNSRDSGRHVNDLPGARPPARAAGRTRASRPTRSRPAGRGGRRASTPGRTRRTARRRRRSARCRRATPRAPRPSRSPGAFRCRPCSGSTGRAGARTGTARPGVARRGGDCRHRRRPTVRGGAAVRDEFQRIAFRLAVIDEFHLVEPRRTNAVVGQAERDLVFHLRRRIVGSVRNVRPGLGSLHLPARVCLHEAEICEGDGDHERRQADEDFGPRKRV